MPSTRASKSVGVGVLPHGIEAGDISRLCAKPGFMDAARRSAAGMVEIYRNTRLLNAILNDRGRFLISNFALYLHFTSQRDPGVVLTAARLKAMAVREGVCSPGRATAIIALMRWGGFLAPAPSPTGERSQRLVITPRLLAVQTQRSRRQWGVMRSLAPEADQALARLGDPDFIAGFRFIDLTPELRPLFERNAGLMIILSLVAGGSGDTRLAPETTSISISDLARRFGVSRPHVIALLRDAQSGGLLEREGETIRISETLSRVLERFFALIFLWNRDCIRTALAQTAKR